MPKLIKHPLFNVACEGLSGLINSSKPGMVGRLCGPSGAGKSEVVVRTMQEHWGDPALWENSRVPVAILSAARVRGGRFEPKHFAARVWAAIQDPDLRWMSQEPGYLAAYASGRLEAEQSELYRAFYRGKTEGALRDAAATLALARGLEVLFVQDAHSMNATTRHVRPADYVQPWVSLAEQTGTRIIFVGTPTLLDLWDGEDESHRRSCTVFMGRYRVDTPEEQADFGKLINSIAQAYTWSPGYVPRTDAGFIYLMTMGVFGQIDILFTRAQLRAKERGSAMIGAADLRKAAMRGTDLRRMMQNVIGFDIASAPVAFDEAKQIHDEVLGQMKDVGKKDAA